MSYSKLNSTTPGAVELNIFDYVDDLLIEDIWNELDKQVAPELIRQVALEIAAKFQDATITTFVPIFIRRWTYERLQNRVHRQ